MDNFTTLIRQQAEQHPHRLALSLPDYARLQDGRTAERLTFGALWGRISACARQLDRMGVAPGHRVLVLVPLSSDLYVVALALMSLGAVVVLANAGFDRKRLAQAVRSARVQGVVSTKRVLKYRFMLPFLRQIPLKAALDGEGLGLRYLDARTEQPAFAPVHVAAEQGALITFTSGSTGRPKAACRTHHTLIHQHRALKEAFPPPEGEVALTCFPVVALHHLCCGVSSVLPALDFKDTGAVQPRWILQQIEAEGVTALTGAPAFLQALTHHCLQERVTLHQIKRLGIGGAPVGAPLCEAVSQVFPEAEAAIIYGSTEAEPVASIDLHEVLHLHAGGPAAWAGYPAGYVHGCAAVRLIRPHAGPVALQEGQALADWEVEPGAWGEVVVSGPHVNTAYFDDPEADRAHKIRDEAGRIWHRMGEVACRDAAGRLWLGGRLTQAIRHGPDMFYPFPWELRLSRIPGIRRAALQADGGRVRLWVEGAGLTGEARAELRRVIAEMPFPVAEVLACPALPVDTRHRSKIDYAALDRQAQRARRLSLSA